MPGDLHTHTTFSDGSTPADKLPFLAACAGMTHLAISDHDSIQSVRYAYAHPVMLKESSLIDCVRDSLKAYIGNIASLEALLTGIDQTSINQALAKEYSDHITDNESRLEQVLEFKARLYESLVGGMLTKEEYASYKAKYTKQAEDIRESVRVLKEKLTEVLENRSERNRWISQFTQFSTLETLDRRALIHMVQSIRVRGKKELDITFTHEDEYKKALQLLALAAQQKDYEQRKVG